MSRRGCWSVFGVVAALLVGGLVVVQSRVLCDFPQDSRSYAGHACWDWHNVNAMTFDGAVGYYGIDLPVGAEGVRFYIDGGAFNGGDGFYLRFTAPRAEVNRSLAAMAAAASEQTGEQFMHAEAQSGVLQEYGIDWSLDPHRSYAAYQYTDTRHQTGGTVIVDDGGADPVVYIVASGG